MNRWPLSFVAVALLAALAVPAHAGTATPRVHRREARQQARIAQGVRSGELTRGETRRLERGERRIHRMERRAKSDGVVTPRERRHMNRALDHQSRRIWRARHNARTR